MAIIHDRIGQIFFASRLRGELDLPGRQVVPITDAWEDGTAYAEIGARSQPPTLVFRSVARNAADADQFASTIKTYQTRTWDVVINETVKRDWFVLQATVLRQVPVLDHQGGVLWSGQPIGVLPTAYHLISAWTLDFAGVIVR